MTSVTIDYSGSGRGAWKGGGYRLAPAGSYQGLVAARSMKLGRVHINDYAVNRAVEAVQFLAGMPDAQRDGIFGPVTDRAVRRWQTANRLQADGNFGPLSARTAWAPAVARIADGNDAARTLMRGLISVESNWDHGAIGRVDTADVGIAQINSVHGLSAQERLDPNAALAFMFLLVKRLLYVFDGQLRDAVAAYNLGPTGARAWIDAGRPRTWHTGARDIADYVDKVLAAAA